MKCDEPTVHAYEQEQTHGGDGNAGIAAKVGSEHRHIEHMEA